MSAFSKMGARAHTKKKIDACAWKETEMMTERRLKRIRHRRGVGTGVVGVLFLSVGIVVGVVVGVSIVVSVGNVVGVSVSVSIAAALLSVSVLTL